jgi:hypothetical protein
VKNLTQHRLTRRLLTTVALGSLGDWITFSALVLVVHRLTQAGALSAFSVALVALARLVPGVIVGPLVAPYAGVLGMRRTIAAADATRALLVAALAFAPNVWALAGILALLELVGSLGSATREAAISQRIDPAHFAALNTATGVLSYGMIPVGAFVAALAAGVSPSLPFALNAGALAICSALMARTPELDGPPVQRTGAPPRLGLDGVRSVARGGLLRDAVVAATIGILAIVMLFSLGPSVASELLGSSAQHGDLVAVLWIGAVAGAVLAQRKVSAAAGLLAAAAGSLMLPGPRSVSVAGIVLIGVGAAVAYVDTQARLQGAARTPAEFAAAFAVMKSGAFAAMLVGPQLWLWGGLPAAAAALAVITAGGALWFAHRLEGTPLHAVLLRGLSTLVLSSACRIRVAGTVPNGPAILVANHPGGLDGVLGVWLDRRIRPVAKQDLWKHPIARLGLQVSRAIPTRSGALDAAIEYLTSGGIVWIAPEGRINRTPHLTRARSGAARMALATGAPIVPMAIFGTGGLRLRDWRPWRRPEVRIEIGEAVHVEPGADPEGISHAFMGSLAAMLGQEYLPGPADLQAAVAVPTAGRV